MAWQRKLSMVKAKAAATRAGTGAVASGGLALLVLQFMRNSVGLPWDVSYDAAIAAAMASFGGTFWAWLRTYLADKAKHGGNAPSYTPVIALLACGLILGGSLAGCQTIHREILPDGTVIEQHTYDIEMTMLVIDIMERGLDRWYQYELERGERSRAEIEAERERREAAIDKWYERLERLIELSQEAD